MTLSLPASAGPSLDNLYHRFQCRQDIADPIQRVRNFASPRDREIVGLLSAGLSFGRVTSVLQSIDSVLEVMGRSPATFIRYFDPREHCDTLGALTHRWVRGPDLLAFLWVVRQMLEGYGSIERFFLEGHRDTSQDVGEALESFSERAMAVDLSQVYVRGQRRGVSYFFPRPSNGSACKRLNLYLRWMVRRDQLDFGIWSTIRPAQLVIPLDTHMIKVGQCLGLTRYRSPGWAMAREITASLRRFDPNDPVKYDFALCHVGMMDQCGFRENWGAERCPLREWCRPRRRIRRRSRRPSDRR